jgi:tetratricopeptide (TPR) repeat protein
MKKIYVLFAVFIMVVSCTSSRKFLERGNYDAAIKKSVKKLMKNPGNTYEIDILKRAYTLANNKDKESIKSLKYSGQPDIWESIYHYYDRMRARQEVVERLPQQVLTAIDHQHVDYAKNRAEAKAKAAKFLYAHAQELLKNNNRQDARKAYDELVRLNNFYPNYPNVRQLMDEALLIGTNNVLFEIRNQTKQVMPKDFEAELKKITLKKLNKQWLNFDTREDKNLYYDYVIYLNLKAIDVSPEHVKELHYDETKTIKDGFRYVLDANGNVMKDSLGNDIKEPNYVTIKCHIVETRMEKSAIVHGTLDFYDNRSKQLVKTFPITAENTFLHRYGYATGNLKAMKEETKKIIGLKPVPFPSNLQMIYDTNENLKKVTYDIIRNNRSLLTN